MRRAFCLAAVFAALLSVPVLAKGSHSSHSSGHTSHSSHTSHRSSAHPSSHATHTTHSSASTHAKTPTTHPSTYCESCARDGHGRILRGSAAKGAFMRSTGFPKGRKGYVVDHIVPLACGGADDTSNMQWQAAAAAKAKDKVERAGCHV
jgi:hypothetical protein